MESGLRDEVGRKAIDYVYEFCDRLVDVVYQGEQPILELEKRNLQMQDEMEEIRGRLR